MDRQPEPPAHLDQDKREGDRDPEAPVQDIIEEAVPRVIVLLDVSPEPLFLKQKLPETVKPPERIALAPPGSGIRREPVETAKVLPDVQVRVLGLGDKQRRDREVYLGLRTLNGGGELAKRWVGLNTETSRPPQQPGAW